MTPLANRTSRRHDEVRAHNTFNRAAAFHATSVQQAQLAALFFHGLGFRFLA
jgi:hypothetical protein